jgi:hypothetical protein
LSLLLQNPVEKFCEINFSVFVNIVKIDIKLHTEGFAGAKTIYALDYEHNGTAALKRPLICNYNIHTLLRHLSKRILRLL